MAMGGSSSTEAVLTQHLQALLSRNLDSVVRDFTDDAVVFTPNGTFKGPENIRLFFTSALDLLTPAAMGNLKVIKQEIDGEYAYVLWSAAPALAFARGFLLYLQRQNSDAVNSLSGQWIRRYLARPPSPQALVYVLGPDLPWSGLCFCSYKGTKYRLVLRNQMRPCPR